MAEEGTPAGASSVLGAAPTPGSPIRLIGLVVVVLVVVSILSFPSRDRARAASPTPTARLLTAVLTPEVADGYVIRQLAGEITATAPTQNVGSNLRLVFWSSDAPSALDVTSCSTWAKATSEKVQQGAALRITDDAGRVRAITVTKNVALDAYWVFNVHVWDSASGDLHPVGSVDLQSTFTRPDAPDTPLPLPWRMCARTEGSLVRLKVWLRSEPEPAWDDPAHGGAVTLPADAPTTGAAGWYVGHLHPGMRATFTELGDHPVPLPAEPAGSAR